MFTNFKELEAYVLSHKNKKRIVLANAHDEPALSAVVNAHRRGVVDGTLLGKKDEILALLREMNEDPAEYEIVDFDGPELDAAKAAVQKAYQDYKNNGYSSGADLDDWRVEYMAEDWYRAYPNGTLIAYNLNYEYHAQKPANVTLAGGAYVDEDGWLMPDYPYCHYLFFTETDGQYTFLEEWMLNDGGPGSKVFDAEMQRWAVELGLSSVADTTPEELLHQLYDGMGGQFLTQLSSMSETDRQTVCQKLDVILQEGTAEQQSLYLDAVQTMAWCSHSFDGAQ